jgi:hypothetical protein
MFTDDMSQGTTSVVPFSPFFLLQAAIRPRQGHQIEFFIGLFSRAAKLDKSLRGRLQSAA